MDEKLGIRFQKMQKCKIIHILHFCLRKEVKIYLMQFSTESELCIPSEDQDIDSPSCCHKAIFTQQPNLEIS